MSAVEARISEPALSREERNKEAADLAAILSDSLKASPGYNQVKGSPIHFICGSAGEFIWAIHGSHEEALHIGFRSGGGLVELHSHKENSPDYLGLNRGQKVTRNSVFIKKGDEEVSLSQEFRDGEPYDSHFSHKSADRKWMLDKPTVSADILGFFESLNAS